MTYQSAAPSHFPCHRQCLLRKHPLIFSTLAPVYARLLLSLRAFEQAVSSKGKAHFFLF